MATSLSGKIDMVDDWEKEEEEKREAEGSEGQLFSRYGVGLG
jgi:hypothetical protein